MENAAGAATGGAEYRFFVLQVDISAEHQELLYRQVNKAAGFSLDIIDVSKYIEGINFDTAKLIFTVAAYFRLLAPYLLREYEQVIYLDCDTICLEDIALLLDYEYGDAVLGAAHRPIPTESDDGDYAWVKGH
ncbi:hypothetical protein AGMMS49587_13850 [Spirochaetia bacterium]|nr:hypothetical protein AGMMS49587_13850 [Spirochaetia bacterium]